MPAVCARNWPTGGAAIIEIKVTLPTIKFGSERLVWLKHFSNLTDRNGSLCRDVHNAERL
jgi:hypothetical protein